MLPNDKIKTRNMSNEFTFDYFFLKKRFSPINSCGCNRFNAMMAKINTVV